jgi:hypothetical protein
MKHIYSLIYVYTYLNVYEFVAIINRHINECISSYII